MGRILVNYLDYLIKDQQERCIFVDIETTGLNPRQDKILSIAWYRPGHKRGVLFVESEDHDKPWQDLLLEDAPELHDETIAKVFHNCTFDTSFLANNGIILKGPILDSIILSQMVNENRKLGLDVLSLLYIGPNSLKAYKAIEDWRKLHRQKQGDYSQAPKKLLYDYNLEDVENTHGICKAQVGHLQNTDKFLKQKFNFKKTPIDYFEEEAIPFERSTFKLSNRGIRVDKAAVQAAEAESKEILVWLYGRLDYITVDERAVILDVLHENAKAKKKTQVGKDKTPRPKFNWASTKQVGELVYEVLLLKNHYVGKSETGKYSTSDAHIKAALLKKIPDKTREVLKLLSQAKTEEKFLNTDVVGLLKSLEGDFLFPVFKQTSDDKTPGKGTATGRLSSSRNVQNIPPRARHFYIPTNPDSIFVYADYSQLELRLAAHLSMDKKMLEAFKRDEDLHTLTANILFPGQEIDKRKRQIAKTSNFLKIYNGSPKRHQQQLFEDADILLSEDECRDIHDRYFAHYEEYKRFLDSLRQFLLTHKFIYSPSGRIRRLPELNYASGLNRHGQFYNGPDYSKLKGEQEAYNKKNKKGLSLYEYVSMKVRHALNQGYNFPAQSLGATICKKAVMKLHTLGYDIVNNIHDSVIIELPKSEYKKHLKLIKNALESVYTLRVPLKVEMKVLRSFSEEDKYEEAA